MNYFPIREKVQLPYQVLLSSHSLLSRESPSLERIHSQQRISCLRICDRRCTQQSPLGTYEDTFLRFGFELIRMKLFHISIVTPNFKKRQLWFLAKPQFILCRLNGL